MGNIHQLSVGNMPKGKVGQLYGEPRHYMEESFGNATNRAAEVTEVVVDTATNDATYDLTIFGETVSYTADGTAAKDEITAGLLEAIEANIVTAGLVTVEDDGVDTLTITARYPGMNLAITTESALMTITQTTAEDEGDTIPFGVAVMLDPNDDTRVVPYTATAKSVAATLTYDASIEAIVTIEVGGTTYHFEHTQATDADASVAALVTEINATLPASTVLASSAGAVLTLTGEVIGQDFTAGFGFGPGTVDTGAWAVVTTAESSDFVGFTRYTYEEASNTIGDSTDVGYPPGRDVIVLKQGRLYVEGGNAATKASAVYLGTSGAEQGRAFTAAGSGRVLIDDGSLKWHAPNVLEVRKGF